jgi:hypothetical protein
MQNQNLYESTCFDKASSHVLALYDANFTAPEHQRKNGSNIPNVPIIIQICVMDT